MKPSTHRISRRQLLRIGGVGALGLGLPELLRAAEPAAAVAVPSLGVGRDR